MKRRNAIYSLSILSGLLILCSPLLRSAADQTYEDMKMLVEVLNLIKDNYVQEVETKKLVYGAAAGMVKALDPF
jgi:carboxyl-terminal processing protease